MKKALYSIMIVAFAAALLALPAAAVAQTSWIGGTSANWSEPLNWTGTVPDATTGAVFDANSTGTVTTNQDIAGLTVPSIANGAVPGGAGANPVSISGLGFTLDLGGISNAGATQDLSVNTDLVLSADQTWSEIAGRTLTIGSSPGSNTVSASGSPTLTIDFPSAGTTVINSNLTNGSGTLSVNIGNTDAAGSILKIAGNNTYTGATTIRKRSEHVQIASDSAFGNGGLVTISSAGGGSNVTLSAVGGAHSVANNIEMQQSFLVTGSNSLTFNGSFTVTTTRALTTTMAGGTSLAFNGPVSLPTGVVLTTSVVSGTTTPVGTFVYNGVVSGGGSFILSNGNFTDPNNPSISVAEFYAQNTFTGGVSLEGGQGSTVVVGVDSMFDGGGALISGPLGTGTLSVSQTTNAARIQAALGARTVGNNVALTQSLRVQGTNDLRLTGIVSGLAGFNKVDSGTLTLTNASNSYSGTTAITGGTVAVGNNTALGGSSVTLNGGAIQASGGARTIANATSIVGSNGGTISGANDLTFTGQFTNSGGNRTLTVTNTGTTTLSGGVNLSNDANNRTLTINATGKTLINSAITNGGTSTASNFTKGGTGTLTLTGLNTYAGRTIVEDAGVLLLNAAATLPINSRLTLRNGGVLGLGVGNDTFIRFLGNAAGQVELTGTGGGWAAYGGNKVVKLNNDDVTPIIWRGAGPGAFFNSNQLVLGNDDSDSTVEFQNVLDLNSGASASPAFGTIQVRNGTAMIDGKMSREIKGTGTSSSLTKTNPGTLELSAANTYQGTTSINSGVLLLTNANSIPGGINGLNTGPIVFGGNGNGTIGLGIGDFTTDLGTGAGKVDLGAEAGFAAFYANRVVNFGGNATPTQVIWRNSTGDAGKFVVSALRLSDVVADATVDFRNPIDLNAGARTVSTLNGTANIDAVLSGVISGTSSSLLKTGGGTLKLTAANTYDNTGSADPYGTTISAGRLLVSNMMGSGTGSGPVSVVNTGSTLGGTGTISGVVTVNTGAHLAAGESIGTLTVGGLTLETGSVLDVELDTQLGIDVSDLVNISMAGGLTINGGSVAVTNFAAMTAGTYTIMDYDGALGGSVANLGTPTGPAGFTYRLNDNTTSKTVELIVGVAGDYDSDGTVDAADYVMWRMGAEPLTNEVPLTTPNTTTPEDYDAWAARFGSVGGSAVSSSLGNSGAVPEPATLVLLLVIVPLIARREFVRRPGRRDE